MCKSIQHGVVPPTASLQMLNPLIDQDLPFQFAFNATKLTGDALVAISAAAWGGVNSHVVLKLPPKELLKSVDARQKRYFTHVSLAAPPSGEKLGTAASVDNTTNASANCVSKDQQNV